jgi:hypothetical protein
MILKAMSVLEHMLGGALKPLGIGDDYFTAPFALVPFTSRKSKSNPNPQREYKMVFTADKIREVHQDALHMFGKSVLRKVELLDSVGDIEEGAFGPKVKRENWVQFREHVHVGGEDICHQLDLYAFKTACSSMQVPEEAVQAALPSWRAMKVEEWGRLAQLMRSPVARARAQTMPIVAERPEWSPRAFHPPSNEQRAEAEAEAVKERARLDAVEKKRKREELEEHLDSKKKRYAPALAAAKAKHPDPSVIDEEETCVTVFEASEDYGNEEPIRCPYDRKNGGLFCSMCLVMAERCGA